MRTARAPIALIALPIVLASCAAVPADGLSPRQRALRDTWEAHMKGEFADKDVDETMRTMVEPAHVNHVPTMTGGTGFEAIRSFYGAHFIPKMPPDTAVTPVSRTIGETQIVDEMIFSFTHTVQMDWMLPGVAPTGRRVEVPLVAIIGFKDGIPGSSTFRAVSAPATGSASASSIPSCTSTEAWSQ